MMSTSFKRMTALALPVALCWVTWSLMIAPPLESIAADRDDMARDHEALRHYERLVGEIPRMRGKLAMLREQDQNTDYVPPGTTALMAALMQNRVQGLVSSTAAVLRTSRTMQGVAEKGFERVGVEIALAATATDLKKLLWALSTAKPAILVDRLAIQTPETEQPPEADARPTFEVELTLSSFARPRPADIGAAP